MLLTSWLPIFILIQIVTSVDRYKTKRVPRQVEAPYNFNHPPVAQDTYIPVKIIYDEDDEEKVRIHNQNTPKESETYFKDATSTENDDNSTEKRIGSKVQAANHPPAIEEPFTLPIAMVNDKTEKNNAYIESSSSEGTEQENKTVSVKETTDGKNNKSSTIPNNLRKPKARSNNIDTPPFVRDGNYNATSGRKPEQRGRIHRVRKTKINKKLVTGTTLVDQTENTTKRSNERKVTLAPTDKIENNNPSTRYTNFQKRTQQKDPIVPIVDSENYVFAYNGDFHYSYEGGDGTKAFERGELKTVKDGSSGTGVVGGYSYKDGDGNDFSLSYTADENGYRPIGDHLPTPPPIPPAIQRALDFLATKTTPETITERIKRS